MELINSGMRKGIKSMCVVCQTAQFVSLMPKPQDFVTRIVGDVVYLSAQVKTLSDNMNKLLDSYANIPTDYLMTQMNSITGSLTNITDRVSTYAQNAVNQSIGLAENTAQMISELTGTVIDTTGAVVGAVTGVGSAVAETSMNIIGQTDTASEIHDGAEVILEWSGNGFNNIKDDATRPLNNLTNKLKNTRSNLTQGIENTANSINEGINDVAKPIVTLIENLRNGMKKLESVIDGGFKDVTGMSSVANEADKVSQALTESGNTTKEAQAVNAVTTNLSAVIKNFSVGKMVMAFTGVLSQSVIVKLGLNELPPIDFESMLYKIRDDMEMTSEDLYEEYERLNKELDNSVGEFKQFGEDSVKIPTEDRDYSTKNYKEFIKQYETELKGQREKIRNLMKSNIEVGGNDALTKKELRSAISEVRKYRKQVKNAKQTKTLKDIINDELDNLKKETEYRCNSLKSDWNSMMAQYKKAIKEIKSFFTSGGSCDMFIDDCCDKINKDCDDIKALCKNLMSQLICSGIKVGMPADIGTVFPNPAYKIADFWMDIKTIIKFIKDLITLVIDIINNINKLARLMLNGIKNLSDIIKQLMELLGLKWLMDLIQSIIDLFGDNISNVKVRLENTLSPVYFSDTDEYNNTIEALDEILENQKMTKEHSETLADTVNLLSNIRNKEIDKLIDKINDVRKTTNISSLKEDDVEELIEDLDKQGERIVAYKSPILQETGSSSDVSSIANGTGSMDTDVKFVGWHYFHPNLEHTKNTYYGSISIIDKLLKRIKSKIIKKAAKTGHKKKGGVAKLKSANVGTRFTKIDKAYVAFYWYTYYTEDLEKDCFDNKTDDGAMIIDSVIQTQNGSIVEITDINGKTRQVFVADNMVRRGDYVVVDGVRYRVGGKKVN